MTEQIDETLLNALHWEDIPLAPDGNGVYVADDHFDAVAREEAVELYEDPTPRLEAKTDHLLMTTLRDMGETARDVTETIATDGGATVDDLADQLGKHPATIYRAINEIADWLEGKLDLFAGTHCTGFEAQAILADRLPEAFRPVGVGSKIELPPDQG